MKKMVILGNGFDLGGELPTKYENYFEDYKENNKELLSVIKGFYNSPGMNTDSISQFVNKKAPSIWNLYFWDLEENQKQNNENLKWSDVESQISWLINNISDITFIEEVKEIKKIEDVSSLLFERYNKQEKKYNKQKDKFRFICDYILIERYGMICKSDYLSILKRELVLFEENFREYIAKISETYIVGSKTYRDNFFKVTNNRETDFFVLNFNYTDFSSKQQKESVLITRDKKEINVEQMNVHGVYYSKIIFGIDQTDQNDENFYPFTKTYRKMELYNEIPVTKMPEPQDIDEIIIYGHSLSKADYSYFHSVFDYYDIYGSGIIVSFAYSLYDEDRVEELKNDHVQNVMKLLRYYGDKMFDRERGKNLVHKMLLENRLRIREVKLNPLEKLKKQKTGKDNFPAQRDDEDDIKFYKEPLSKLYPGESQG